MPESCDEDWEGDLPAEVSFIYAFGEWQKEYEKFAFSPLSSFESSKASHPSSTSVEASYSDLLLRKAVGVTLCTEPAVEVSAISHLALTTSSVIEDAEKKAMLPLLVWTKTHIWSESGFFVCVLEIKFNLLPVTS